MIFEHPSEPTFVVAEHPGTTGAAKHCRVAPTEMSGKVIKKAMGLLEVEVPERM